MMKYYLIVFILFCSCMHKQQIKCIELPFKVSIPGDFDISTDPGNNRYIEIITLMKGRLHSIELSIKDSINPDAYQYFMIKDRDSYNHKKIKIGDTIFYISSDGISKLIERNGNLIWSKDYVNTERTKNYHYKGDTLIERQYQKDGNELLLQLETKYLFSKDNKLICCFINNIRGELVNYYVYNYDSNNRITNIAEYNKAGTQVGYKKVEYIKNSIITTSFFDGKIEEVDSVNKDSLGRVIKKVTNSFDSALRTKYYFYDSLEQKSLVRIKPEILFLIKKAGNKG